MENKEEGKFYIHFGIGTVGLLLIGVALIKCLETVGGLDPLYGLLGVSLSMIYLGHLEEKVGMSKKLGWIRFFIVVSVTAYIFF